MESWASSSSSGIAGAVRYTFLCLVQWGNHPGAHVMPASYSHRQTLAGLEVAGPKRILHVILEEVKLQAEAPGVGVVYDVATAMICAPEVSDEGRPTGGLLNVGTEAQGSWQRRPTLRETLKAEAEDWSKMQKKDPALAEIVVRLYRRVEAQMSLPPPQPILAGEGMQLGLAGAADDLANALGGAAGVQGDAMAVDSTALDMGLAGVSADLGLGDVSSHGGGLDAGGDADLFDLDANIDFDNWDDMGL